MSCSCVTLNVQLGNPELLSKNLDLCFLFFAHQAILMQHHKNCRKGVIFFNTLLQHGVPGPLAKDLSKWGDMSL